MRATSQKEGRGATGPYLMGSPGRVQPSVRARASDEPPGGGMASAARPGYVVLKRPSRLPSWPSFCAQEGSDRQSSIKDSDGRNSNRSPAGVTAGELTPQGREPVGDAGSGAGGGVQPAGRVRRGPGGGGVPG